MKLNELSKLREELEYWDYYLSINRKPRHAKRLLKKINGRIRMLSALISSKSEIEPSFRESAITLLSGFNRLRDRWYKIYGKDQSGIKSENIDGFDFPRRDNEDDDDLRWK